MTPEVSVGSRDIEGVMEDLDYVYRRIDEAEEAGELEDLAHYLDSAAQHAAHLAALLRGDVLRHEMAQEEADGDEEV